MKFKAEATKSVLRNCVSRVAADVRRRIPRQNRTVFRLLLQLASAEPLTYAPALARSLHVLGVMLTLLGRPKEALAVTEETASLYASLLTLVQIFIGDQPLLRACELGKIEIDGPSHLVKSMPAWFPRSKYAMRRLRAADQTLAS